MAGKVRVYQAQDGKLEVTLWCAGPGERQWEAACWDAVEVPWKATFWVSHILLTPSCCKSQNFFLIKSTREPGREASSSYSVPIRYRVSTKLNIVPSGQRETFRDPHSDVTEQSKKGDVRAEKQDTDDVEPEQSWSSCSEFLSAGSSSYVILGLVLLTHFSLDCESVLLVICIPADFQYVLGPVEEVSQRLWILLSSLGWCWVLF